MVNSVHTFAVEKIEGSDWLEVMANFYGPTFNRERPKEFERCTFALAVFKDKAPCGFVTCIEMGSGTLYWQWGGAFDEIKRSISVIEAYISLIWKAKALGFKRIMTKILNTNVAMLKLAMRCGFLIVGACHFKGAVYLELLNELEA